MSVNEVKLKRAPVDFDVRGTGPPGSRTFAIGNEDHTLGNALRHVLVQNAGVEFAGYSVPHPSEPMMHLRVQTAKKPPGQEREQVTAAEALKEACNTLSSCCDVILQELERLVPEVKDDRIRLERIHEQEAAEQEEDDEEGEMGYDDYDEDGGGAEEELY